MFEFSIKVPGAKSYPPLKVYSPYDQKLVGQVATIDSEGAELALANAQAIFADKTQWLTPEQRVTILEKVAAIMKKERQELAQIALSEGGKPLKDTEVEVDRAIDGIYVCIECLRSNAGEEIPMNLNKGSSNRLAFTHPEPIGPVVAVSAFNHPLNLIIHQIGPAIAAGCPVIVKPAEDTPLSCFKVAEIFQRAGLPEGYCQAVAVTDISVATQLVTDPRVHFFSFIGSAAVGWKLKSLLAPGTRCALEHGGLAPAIVSHDANLDKVIPLLGKGGFYHSGQVCVSVQRIFVDKAISSNLCSGLKEYVSQISVGDPALASTDCGPLIRPREVDRVESWVKEAIAEGAELLCGGKRLSDSLYSPTLLLNPSAQSQVSQKEIFGPVVCIYTYDKIEEAFSQANNLPFAFQASVMTEALETMLRSYKQLQASAVMVNDHTAFRVDWMPFAGLKQSGYGVGGIGHTFEEMQIDKMLVIHSDQV